MNKYNSKFNMHLVIGNCIRKITLVVMTFFFSAFANAKCGGNGIYCLSKSSRLNKNGIIILEFYTSSQSLITYLNTKYPIYLKSDKGNVFLNIIETLKGEMNLTQIVLKPSTELKVNETYSLEIDNLPKYEEKLERYNYLTNKREKFTFTINNFTDINLPKLISSPIVQKKTLARYGCGPASWVYFSLIGQDESELFVRASVKNNSTGKITTYILNLEDSITKIGHGMCSGAFLFDNSKNYEVVFQLYDQSGNKSNFTEPILFTKPSDLTNEE